VHQNLGSGEQERCGRITPRIPIYEQEGSGQFPSHSHCPHFSCRMSVQLVGFIVEKCKHDSALFEPSFCFLLWSVGRIISYHIACGK